MPKTSETQSTENHHSITDQIIPVITKNLNDPFVVILFLYFCKKVKNWFSKKTVSLAQTLWISEDTDRKLSDYLTILRESIECDRIVLGLIVQGNEWGSLSYNIRELVIIQESCAVDVPMVRSFKHNRYIASALDKESKLYGDKQYIHASVSQQGLDPSCRRYLDSINALYIWTYKLTKEQNGNSITIGYLSFQWTQKNSVPIADLQDLEDALLYKGKRDFTYYKNQINEILLSTFEKKNFFDRIINLFSGNFL